MFLSRRACVSVIAVSVAAYAADQTWKDKKVAEWSADEAQQVLTDSPWTKTVTPTIDRSSTTSSQPRRGGMGGMGGMGGGRRGGGGYPQSSGQSTDDSSSYGPPPSLRVRWESALPVREAELKTKDNDAPTLDQDHYAIAVYGVPSKSVSGDPKHVADQLKKRAVIKRDGKKDLKPSSVEVLQRDDGPVIVYLFPRSTEITKADRRAEFDAEAGRFQFSQSFFLDEMAYQGKLEL